MKRGHSHRFRRQAGARHSGFSLVELLTVISIMAIIMVAGSAAFRAMSGGGARQRAAANDVVGMIDQARSRAIASGGDVYLAFANGDPNLDTERQYRAMAIFRPGPTPTDPPVRETAWTPLPVGVSFYADSKANRNLFASGTTKAFEYASSEESAATVDVPYLMFNAQGVVVEPQADNLNVYLFQGVYSGTSIVPTRKKDDGNPVLDRIQLSRFTGRVKHLSDL